MIDCAGDEKLLIGKNGTVSRYGGSISTVVDNSGLISLTYSGFISMGHRGTMNIFGWNIVDQYL